MAGPCVLNDTSDLEELSKPQGLFLKPIARLNISVQLPHLTEPGKTISNWEVMEKMKGMAKPDSFTMIKVAKSTMDFVRFEAEVESKSILKNVLTRIDGGTIKLSGFTETLKVKAAEAKLPFPVRHDWDSFFRDSKDMNEMVPGERPDTIHLELLPCKWFYDQRFNNANRPSPHVLQKVFESFGEIRCVDIPVLDPYRRNSMKDAKTFSTFDAHLTFEAFIQYVEYISFVKAMDALRGMKLVFREKPQLIIPKKTKEAEETDNKDGMEKGEEGAVKEKDDEEEKGEDWKAVLDLSDEERKNSGEKEKPEEASDDKKDDGAIRLEPRCWMADIKVDFDKTKHLTDEKLQKRKGKMEKFIREQKEKIEKEQKRREDEARRREEEILNKEQAHLREISEKEAKRREREEKRRKKRHEQKIAIKIATEERKILIASRKLETIRLLEELFNRIRLLKHQEQVEQRMLKLEEMKKKELDNAAERQLKEEARKLRREEKRRQKLLRMEEVFKKRLVLKMKAQQEKQKEINREKARLEIQVKGSKLSSAASVAVMPAIVHQMDKVSKKPRRVASHGVLAREKFHEEKQREFGKDNARREGYEHSRRKRKVDGEEYDASVVKKERHRRGDEEGEVRRRSESRGKSRTRSKSRGKSQNPHDSSKSDRDDDNEDNDDADCHQRRELEKEDRDDDFDQELINKITSEVSGETSTLLYGKSLSEPKPSTSNAAPATNRGRGNFMVYQNRGRGRNVFGKLDPNFPPRGRGRGFFRGRGRGRGFYPRKNFAYRDETFMRKYYRMPGQEEERSESEDSDGDDDSESEREGKKSRRHKKRQNESDDSDDSSDVDSDEDGAEKPRRRPKPPKKLPPVPMDRPIPVPQQLAYRGMGRPRGYYEFPPDRRHHFFNRGYNHGGDYHGGDYEGGRPPMPLYRRRQEYDEEGFHDEGGYEGRDYEEEPRRRVAEEPRRRVEREHSSSKHKKHKKHKKRKSKETSDEGSDDGNEQGDASDLE